MYINKLIYMYFLQADIPTTIGIGPGDNVAMETEQSDTTTTPSKKYYIDNTFIRRPRENVEMKSPLKDCLSK